MRQRIEEELERLHHGSSVTPTDRRGTVRFNVKLQGDPAEVLRKASTVLEIVDQKALDNWPSLDEWKSVLPAWFVAACASEMTPEEAQAWLARWEKLDAEGRRAEEESKSWALADWLYWMQPDRRAWWWWDSRSNDGRQVAVEVDEWPFPWGSLAWVLKAAGATDVTPEE